MGDFDINGAIIMRCFENRLIDPLNYSKPLIRDAREHYTIILVLKFNADEIMNLAFSHQIL